MNNDNRFAIEILTVGQFARCLMSGGACSTADAALEAAVETCTSERGYAHHAELEVRVLEICQVCQGNGQVHKFRRGKRAPYSAQVCAACKGEGSIGRASTSYVLNVNNPADLALKFPGL